MENFMSEFIALADGIKLTTLAALIVANFLTGLAVSIYSKTFRLKEVGAFLCTRVLPYLVSYGAVCVIAVVEPEWKTSVTIIWGIIIAALVGAILTNLKEMGIKLPDSLAGPPPQ
jgi:phage-related holin